MLNLIIAVLLVGYVESARMARVQGVGDTSLTLWRSFVDRVTSRAVSQVGGSGFQPGCAPQVYEATSKYRGAAMLYHGFTACNQQFENLVPLLTSKGFTVFAPPLPGHGYIAKPKNDGTIQDFVADLPTNETEWENFAHEMHKIMMVAKGEKVLFGLSVGGGVAAFQGHLGGYNRRFLSAPMILAAGIVNNVISLANRYPWRKHQVNSWGDDCEITERQGGRAGNCQFTAAIGAAARNLGQQHSYDAIRDGGNFADGGIQMVFVDEDTAVSTNAIINLAIKYGLTKTSPMVCGMKAEVGHSFLSPYDSPLQNKWWLTEATQKIADYLADGVLLSQDASDGTATSGWPRCYMKSTP